jgi:integrase
MSLELKGTLKPGEPDRRYYMIRVQVENRRVPISSGTRDRKLAEQRQQMVVDAIRKTPKVTKEELVALIRGVQSPRHLAIVRQSKELTLKAGVARCFADRKVWGRIKGQDTHKINTNHLIRHFGADKVLKNLTEADIEGYIERRLSLGNAPSTVNRQLSCLGRVLADAKAKGDISAIPPIHYLQERGGRKFVLSPEQEKKLFEAVLALDDAQPGPQGGPPRRKDAYRYVKLYMALVESGLRLGEALRLRHTDLVFEDPEWPGLIRLRRTDELKNGKARTVPMTRLCREVLMECKDIPGGPFMDLSKRRAQNIFARARVTAGIDDPDCVIHSLRHTCASRLLQALGDIKLVQEWLGHTTILTTATIYAHVAKRSLARAASAMDALRNGTSPDTPGNS